MGLTEPNIASAAATENSNRPGASSRPGYTTAPLDLLRGEETLLQIEFTPRDNGTSDMRLTHKRIARADIREAYREDWPSCFDKLAPLLH
ncbi:protein of unknown function [Methylorubrum extorquens]|uniref:Activator of Hsp90 ATPase homologue 1/2-like C-terminal domain-containing protein n=1 Tax=Methylorubrum extorquens TaxID=408 RepID=A0A2N9AXU4_METEX|nr:protein of unknown function [Methylorubrum extorquens]